MYDLIMWLIVIPMIVIAIKWWCGVGRFLLRNKRSLGAKVEKVRSAFADEQE